MPVETGMYSNIKQPDPVGMLKDMTGLSTGIAQNKLLQFDLLGKTEGGKALQDALDPKTGELDINRLINNLKTNPAGAAATPQVLPGAISAVGGQIANKTAAINVSDLSVKNVGSMWGSRLARSTGPLSRDELVDDVLTGISQGRVDPTVGSAAIRGIPADPAEIRSYAAGGWIQSLPPELQVSAAPAAPTASGAPTQQTGAQFTAQSVGGQKPAPVSGATPPAPGIATPAPKPPPGPGAGVVTGMGPGASAALASTGGANAAMGNELTQLGNGYPVRFAALQNMENDLPGMISGPVTPELTRAIAGFNQLFGTKFAAENVAATERFSKLANQIALQQAGALHASDLTTTTAMGANPNPEFSKLGNQYVIAMLKGNEEAIRVKSAAWNRWLADNHTPDTFGAWSTAFNDAFDPRVFQSKYMSPEDRTKMLDTMKTKEELDTFRQKYNDAVKNGWIPDPRGAK